MSHRSLDSGFTTVLEWWFDLAENRFATALSMRVGVRCGWSSAEAAIGRQAPCPGQNGKLISFRKGKLLTMTRHALGRKVYKQESATPYYLFSIYKSLLEWKKGLTMKHEYMQISSGSYSYPRCFSSVAHEPC
jgi:hypothetical protein